MPEHVSHVLVHHLRRDAERAHARAARHHVTRTALPSGSDRPGLRPMLLAARAGDEPDKLERRRRAASARDELVAPGLRFPQRPPLLLRLHCRLSRGCLARAPPNVRPWHLRPWARVAAVAARRNHSVDTIIYRQDGQALPSQAAGAACPVCGHRETQEGCVVLYPLPPRDSADAD